MLKSTSRCVIAVPMQGQNQERPREKEGEEEERLGEEG